MTHLKYALLLATATILTACGPAQPSSSNSGDTLASNVNCRTLDFTAQTLTYSTAANSGTYTMDINLQSGAVSVTGAGTGVCSSIASPGVLSNLRNVLQPGLEFCGGAVGAGKNLSLRAGSNGFTMAKPDNFNTTFAIANYQWSNSESDMDAVRQASCNGSTNNPLPPILF